MFRHASKICGIWLLITMVLGGCTNETNQQSPDSPPFSQAHQDYLARFSWHIEQQVSTNTYPNGIHQKERIYMIKSGGVDLSTYANENITETIYLLKEKQSNGKLYAHLYEAQSKIIGGHLALEGVAPGIANLSDRSFIQR